MRWVAALVGWPGAAERVGAGDVVEVTQDHMAQSMRERGVAA
jgi:hypothetical protein